LATHRRTGEPPRISTNDAAGTARSLADDAGTTTTPDCNSECMTDDSHDEVTRRSFERQVGLFSGPDSPFARREGTLAWLEPLTADMLVLDAACGAAHVCEVAAPHVRQVVGIDLTVALLELGAARLRAAGVINVLLQEGMPSRSRS
jgi:SAM-dependent methyltransferase